MLFDAHTHINYGEYTPEERQELIDEIEASDVSYVIDAGDTMASSQLAVSHAEKYDWCYAAVGIHPHWAAETTDEDVGRIEQLAANPMARAIGEIGLDFYYGKDISAEQEALFRRQIRLANKLKMPIMIHTRDANRLTMDILKEEGAFSEERKSWFPPIKEADGSECADPRVQLHCFSGSAELGLEYVALGAMLSIGGLVTFKNGKKTAEVVMQVPIEHLLSETDAPYLTPEPFRGRPNKSPYIEHVVRRIALLKGMDYDECAATLMANGKRFFGID